MSQICNRMVEIRAKAPLSLLDLKDKIPNCIYRPAKPCRIYFKYNKCTIQIFPKGCIQILGNNSEDDILNVREYLSNILHPIKIGRPRVKSCTVQCLWKNDIRLNNIPSNSRISNERELFPGTLVNMPRKIGHKVRNYHCALFQDGKAIVTGVSDIHEAESILRQCLQKYIKPHT